MKIHRYGIHKGEEPGVVGNDRAGMVVFAGCHLRCSFCYTPEAAFQAQGERLDLGRVFEFLHSRGAGNLNLITPSHVWNDIRGPLREFRRKHPGFPVVLKVSGYEGLRLAKEMSELADVIVMDFKVFHETSALAVNLPRNYARVATKFLERVLENLPTIQSETGEIRQGIVVRTLWQPALPDEAISIGQVLEQLRFDGAWNLMRFFVDGHRLKTAPAEWTGVLQRRYGSTFEIWKDGRRVKERSFLEPLVNSVMDGLKSTASVMEMENVS